MGFMKWINRVVFGAESVAKSSGKKAVQTGKDVMEDLSQRAEELYEKGKEEVNDWKRKQSSEVSESHGDAASAEEFVSSSLEEDIVPDISKEEIKSEELKESSNPAKSREPQAGDKTKEFVELTGKKVLEAMDSMVHKGEHLTIEGSKKWEKLKAKADDLGQDLRIKFEELLEKAERMAQEEAEEKRRNPTGIREDSTHADALKGSTLSGTEDFFKKAKAFGEGDYSAASDKPVIEKGEEILKEKDDRKVYGFEDMDGDGDEIVDDAIIDEEE